MFFFTILYTVVVLMPFILMPIIFMWSLNTLFGLSIAINYKTWFATVFLIVIPIVFFNVVERLFNNNRSREAGDYAEPEYEDEPEDEDEDEPEDEYEDENEDEDIKMDIAKLFIIARHGPSPDDTEAYKKYIMDKFSHVTKISIGEETLIHFMCVERKLKARHIKEIVRTLIMEKRIVSRFREPFMYKEERDDAGYKVTLILVGVGDMEKHFA